MNAIKELKALHFEQWRAKHPNIPNYAYTSYNYSDKTANNLTRCIIDYINFIGGQAERISSEGKVIDTRQTYTDIIGRNITIGGIKRVYSSTTNGTSDISAIYKGLSIKIEVKIGKDKQSLAQKKYQENIEKAGGKYIIVSNFSDFYTWFKSQFTPQEEAKNE